ncbi:MAG: hypothetical protein KC416_06965 [Myxococcales bacterium]|nr:hypothetical protein [Myxococcales bacterium]
MGNPRTNRPIRQRRTGQVSAGVIIALACVALAAPAVCRIGEAFRDAIVGTTQGVATAYATEEPHGALGGDVQAAAPGAGAGPRTAAPRNGPPPATSSLAGMSSAMHAADVARIRAAGGLLHEHSRGLRGADDTLRAVEKLTDGSARWSDEAASIAEVRIASRRLDVGPTVGPNGIVAQKPPGRTTSDFLDGFREQQNALVATLHAAIDSTLSRGRTMDALLRRIGLDGFEIRPASHWNQVIEAPGFWTVRLHGSPDRMMAASRGSLASIHKHQTRLQYRPADLKEVPVERVAQHLRREGFAGEPVLLWSCSTGGECTTGAKNVAQRLADNLDTAVVAPTEDIQQVVTRSTHGSTSYLNPRSLQGNGGYYEGRPLGQWRIFEPSL